MPASPKPPKGSGVLARYAKKKAREDALAKTKKEVRQRDSFRCRMHGYGEHDGRLEVHHVRPRSLGRDDRRENLMTLCTRHHAMFTANQVEIVFLEPEFGADRHVRFQDKGAA
jgi:hypothetical protein